MSLSEPSVSFKMLSIEGDLRVGEGSVAMLSLHPHLWLCAERHLFSSLSMRLFYLFVSLFAGVVWSCAHLSIWGQAFLQLPRQQVFAVWLFERAMRFLLLFLLLAGLRRVLSLSAGYLQAGVRCFCLSDDTFWWLRKYEDSFALTSRGQHFLVWRLTMRL